MSVTNIKTIHTIPGVSFEKQQKDEIYTNRYTEFDNIGEDKHYGKPDYEVSYFSTTSLKVKSIHPNNLSTYIRPKENLKYLGQKRKISDELLEGIFIVENYNFYSDSGTEISHIYDTIFKRDDLDINHIEIEKIKEYLSEYDKTDYHDKGTFRIRLVSFIDASVLSENVDVYVVNQRTLLSIREDVSNLKHPLSASYDNNVENYKGSNVIIMDLIDNDKHHQEPLYTKFGNEVMKILPRVDTLKPDGLYTKICKEGVTTTNKYTSYSDINDIGVYKSYKETLYNGNIENEMTTAKLELDKKQLIVADEKNELERVKIVNEQINSINEKIYTYAKLTGKLTDIGNNMKNIEEARIDKHNLHNMKMHEVGMKIHRDNITHQNDMRKTELVNESAGKNTIFDNVLKTGTLLTKII